METKDDKKPVRGVEGFVQDTADRLPPPANPAKKSCGKVENKAPKK